MNSILKISALAAALLLGASPLSADRLQDRGLNTVPGFRTAGKGLSVNPTPQSMRMTEDAALDISRGFRISDPSKRFGNDFGFLKTADKGVPLNITFGTKAARHAGVRDSKGAYMLSVTPKGVTIVGNDETGAFYGIQTLRQLLDGDAKSLPSLEIYDWPALESRGVVEGFYGEPWSHRTRLDLIDFYGRNKMNMYIYAPKDDPYHRTPNWRVPYPEKEAADIRELAEACRRNRVDFVWAVHPGGDIKWNQEDYDLLLKKFESVYDLGVRRFAVFFDDISGEGCDSHKQSALINNLTRDFVEKRPDVGNIIIVPTDYTELWANRSERGQLAIYGRELSPKTEVLWTGKYVCGDITPETMEFVGSRIGHPALVWWNYPVTDYCREKLLQGPVYGLDNTLSPENTRGLLSNPMEHGEASQLALYGVADWTWNPGNYNPLDNWERALVYLMPEASDAYRTFAIHNGDTKRDGYRRAESWETRTFDFNDYSPAAFEYLRQEFTRVKAAPAEIRAKATNRRLVGELEPWLVQFEKLGDNGLRTLDLIKTFESNDSVAFWKEYAASRMTPAEEKEYRLHASGTKVLRPFIDNATSGMLTEFHKRVARRLPTAAMPEKLLLQDNDTTEIYLSPEAIEKMEKEGKKTMPFDKLAELGRRGIRLTGAVRSDAEAFDNNPATATLLSGPVTMKRPPGMKEIVVLGGIDGVVTIEAVTAKGDVRMKTESDASMTVIPLPDDARDIRITSTKRINEVIQR